MSPINKSRKNGVAMKIFLANQPLNETLTAKTSRQALKDALLKVQATADIKEFPFEGQMSQIIAGLKAWNGGELVHFNYYGPTWEHAQMDYLLTNLNDRKTAVIDAAAFSSPKQSEAYSNHALWHASSYGLGQIILDAITNEAQALVLLIGKTGMIDGGLGMLQALGAAITDESGDAIPVGENPLINFGQVDLQKATAILQKVEVTILATDKSVYSGHASNIVQVGRKLGLSAEQVVRLDVRAASFSRLMRTQFGLDLGQLAGAGAAGGVAGVLICLGATINDQPFPWLFDILHLATTLNAMDLVLLTTDVVDAAKFPHSLVGELVKTSTRLQRPTIILTAKRTLALSELTAANISTFVLPAQIGLTKSAQQPDPIEFRDHELTQSLAVTSQNILKLMLMAQS